MNIPISPFVKSTNGFSALKSPLYRQYTQLYDEVKCIGCKVVLSIGTPIGTSSVPSIQIVTAWDRRFGKEDDENHPNYGQLKNFGSQQTTVAVNNSIAKISRSIYASDLLEKAQWHDCHVGIDLSTNYEDDAYEAAGANPNFFSPAMWLGVAQGNTSAAQTISFQAEVRYYFAFRNPKWGGSGSSSKSIAPMDEEDVAAETLDLMRHDTEVMDEAPPAKKANTVTFLN